jgi:hypothetical protein
MTATQSEIEKNLKFTPHNAPARFHDLSDSPQSTANSRDRKSSIEGMFSKFQETLIENYRREKRSAQPRPGCPYLRWGVSLFPAV